MTVIPRSPWKQVIIWRSQEGNTHDHTDNSCFTDHTYLFYKQQMKVFVTKDHDTSMVKSEYEVWEEETLKYAPDYYTIENDYDDDMDVV